MPASPSPPARSSAPRRRRVDLVPSVVTQLQQEILSGQRPAGQALPPEAKMCLELGVSRTVVREAMRILQTRGLVVIAQGRLPRVKAADAAPVVDSLTTFLKRTGHSLVHLLEVRRQLETAIAALAAERATPEQLTALEQVNAQLAQASSLSKGIELDLRFHALLAQATGNPVLGLLLEPLAHLMRLSRKTTLSRTGMARAAAGHAAILAAVRRGDPLAAHQAMLEHLEKAEHDLGLECSERRRRTAVAPKRKTK